MKIRLFVGVALVLLQTGMIEAPFGIPSFFNQVPQKLKDIKDWSLEQPRKLRTLSSNPTLAKFQHYVLFLDVYNDQFNKYRNVDELLTMGEECYKFASCRKELNNLTLVTVIFLYMKRKKEMLVDLQVSAEELRSKKRHEMDTFLPIEKMTADMENIIKKFLELVPTLDERSTNIYTTFGYLTTYLSNVQNHDEKADSRKSCTDIVNKIMKPNRELFELYYEGLKELHKTAPGDGVTGFFYAKVKDISGSFSNTVKRITTIKENIRGLQINYYDEEDSKSQQNV